MIFHPLTVSRTQTHIGGFAKTLQFDMPDELQQSFVWQAGQYVIIELTIDNKVVQRTYTISASPHTDKPIQITIKRTREGLVSNYINDHTIVGDIVRVSEPAGQFQLIPDMQASRQHFFFAAGSGITPMMAMIESVLLAEPQSSAYLLYGNHNDETVIFKTKLTELAEQYANRFYLSHAFSSPREDANFPHWRTGRINAEMLKDFLSSHRDNRDAHCYICGPGSMNDDCRANLQTLGIDNANIHTESFVANLIMPEISGVAATATVYLEDEYYTVDIQPEQTLLSAFRQADIDPPFSCQSGTCGDCQATLKSGEVSMPSAPALNQSDIDEGEILTCQSFAKTNQLKVVYES